MTKHKLHLGMIKLVLGSNFHFHLCVGETLTHKRIDNAR